MRPAGGELGRALAIRRPERWMMRQIPSDIYYLGPGARRRTRRPARLIRARRAGREPDYAILALANQKLASRRAGRRHLLVAGALTSGAHNSCANLY